MTLDIHSHPAAAELTPGISPVPDNYRRVVDFLRRRTSYADVPRGVQVIETHISMVFVTDRFVYKLKKPVRFDFLDFSTVELRRQACEDEVRLNNRQARGVYLGVHPIWTDSRGQMHLDGTEPRGPVVDYVVMMRRLPIERTLDELIHRHLLTEAEIHQLAEALCAFYVDATPLSITPEKYRGAIEQHVRANRASLLAACDPTSESLIKRVHAAQLRTLLTQSDGFDRRVDAGRVIEGHGDLRPEHICLISPPVAFDCVEFNAEFRQIDVVDELSFLAMECDMLGAPAVGVAVIEAYERASGDQVEPELLAFYQAYRACVRAKVAALRGGQVVGRLHDESLKHAMDYLSLADGYLRPYDRLVLFVIGGLMGSGKSTLARELSDTLGLDWLRSDVIREQMFPRESIPAGYNADRYQPQARSAVYDELLRQAGDCLRQGVSVAIDATFGKLAQRQAAVSLAHDCDADVVWIECRCPRETAMQRIESRLASAVPDASEARPELYDLQAHDWQHGELDAHGLVVDTTAAMTEQLTQVYAELRSAGQSPAGHFMS
jgi:aminoglycoside phosphotransferase family enzyme/predicted kinase